MCTEPITPSARSTTHSRHEVLAQLREVCLILSGASEGDTFGIPTFRVGTQTFAMLDAYLGVPCLLFRAPAHERPVLRCDRRYFAAPFGADHGWMCLDLRGSVDWGALERHVATSHALLEAKLSDVEPVCAAGPSSQPIEAGIV